jgi:hypothetical protein
MLMDMQGNGWLRRRQWLPVTAVLAAFVCLGVYLLLVSHAATSAVTAEPENGTYAGSTSSITDTLASGGKAIRFGQPASSGSIAIGVYPGYNFPADIDTYTQLAGKAPNVVMWFESWNEPLYYSGQVAGIDARGVTPLITWSPEGYNLADINAGKYDAYIKTQALAAKSYGKPMMIRLAHELNGTWQTFCPCVSGQTNQQFIDFWRRTVDIYRANGATNVRWVWSPNIYTAAQQGGKAFDAMYPGDAYVDWVGLDGYNFGPPNNSWQSLSQVFKYSYDDITKLTTKPLMFAEWGSTENAGDKAAWIRQGFLTDIPQQMPRVKLVVSFDRVAESDFRINSSPTSLSAYQDVVMSPLYNGSFTP